MNTIPRIFEDKPAEREKVPLLIGLMGPSGSGKTYSALRLASGIQQATHGDIYFIDTEARRGLHYADHFKFRHMEFGAPFGSLDYLSAITHCVKKGAGVVIVDSMSHEHDGPGGVLEQHEHELDRMAGQDYGKRNSMNLIAWAKPKAARRQLISGLLQLNCNFIFCFRAKEKAKPVKKDGKIVIENQGWMPIAGEEFVYEQTINCLLLPGSNGVPTWRSDEPGERAMMKLPEQFKDFFGDGQRLDEYIGRRMAEWACGGSRELDTSIMERARQAASGGTDAFNRWWKDATQAERAKAKDISVELKQLRDAADAGHVDKETAAAAEKARGEAPAAADAAGSPAPNAEQRDDKPQEDTSMSSAPTSDGAGTAEASPEPQMETAIMPDASATDFSAADAMEQGREQRRQNRPRRAPSEWTDGAWIDAFLAGWDEADEEMGAKKG